MGPGQAVAPFGRTESRAEDVSIRLGGNLSGTESGSLDYLAYFPSQILVRVKFHAYRRFAGPVESQANARAWMTTWPAKREESRTPEQVSLVIEGHSSQSTKK